MKRLTLTLFTAVLMIAVNTNTFAQKVAEQTREVSGFSKIASAGSFNVHVTLGNTESLKISADDDIIDKIETVVEDETLKIRFKKSEDGSWKNYRYNKVDIYVTAKALNGISNAGSGNINVDGKIKSESFRAVLSGSGSIKGSVNANELNASIAGSGSISLSGSSDNVKVLISGSGELKAKELTAENATLSIAGSGNAYIKADKEIEARIAGSGSVYYTGSAVVNSHTTGSGRVTRAN
ncbi:DUF2807 domain-containing protein [Mucilaginibacter sp. RS28]|uniref:DUF2807 domain-containing protein n=1 Tax=Mucilaginibacter straminoryzae TaxID=2932774 RepID=A0A9X1X5X3_9SPHI|nr:head GIN domain-containing protein [Mucilaginibacter straminoryzae]MCJ8210685.1 DUF2807 domain-containing protein [Mucilaginibacter straminoryzae]